ncbi:MAG: CidA/LrgA family protein [Eubacteriales bacterium]|nr:CidA/LrgA family protein [Eubacteriales bacterium]
MKYLYQAMRILAVVLLAEICNYLIPLPIPTSIYGIVLLFIALQTGIIKLAQIEETADFLLGIMPILFVPTAVNIMNSYQSFAHAVWPVLAILLISTVVTMAVTGKLAQWMLSKKTDKEEV